LPTYLPHPTENCKSGKFNFWFLLISIIFMIPFRNVLLGYKIYLVYNEVKICISISHIEYYFRIQWNLSNPTHQGTKEICQNVQDVGILRFYFSWQKYFGTINFCRMSQDVGKLSCRIAQVPLYVKYY
jgi:hypothetical protein